MYGLHGKISAITGKRPALLELLLQAAEAMQANPDCLIYIVSEDAADPEGIWVSEVWTSAESHQASLAPEETQALIAQARPLIAGMSDRAELRTLGGKGL
ncbi:MAG: antibiotic biosynthesis monooxygenase [Anaerolineales bacterium]|nr:antibiotic biosynthesis monooxygenase [Anaerolineales bacterium]MCW5854790.1 antibiotic biosynthesis monooxygenase [Anaerolineales bacterium]